MSRFEKALLLVNIAFYGFLAVFSYAYVDLNLTLSQNPQFLLFVKTMQQLGYFHRSQATSIYLLFIILAFSFFIINLWLFFRKKVGLRYLKYAAFTNTLILIFAYPFLSSDLFNYLFDAKIILNYHSSPYTHKPLDFPQDEWLRFMRWTHRYSPYGPLWLGMSLLPAALGFGKFILNFLFFKIFIALFHLINAYLIYKILEKINQKKAIFGTAFYALNPLFLIEGIANAHNDVVLATFMLASIYFFVVSKTLRSYLLLFAGALVKYIPVLNLPWLIWVTLITLRANRVRRGESKSSLINNIMFSTHSINSVSTLSKTEGSTSSNNKNKIQTLIILNLLTLSVFTYLFSSFRITVPFVSSGATQVQFQPWYLFWTLPFISLIPQLGLILISLAISFGAFLRYTPFLYYGDWSQPGTLGFMQIVLVIPPAIAIFAILLKRFLTKLA